MRDDMVVIDLKRWREQLLSMRLTAKETTAIAGLLSASIVTQCSAKHHTLQVEHS